MCVLLQFKCPSFWFLKFIFFARSIGLRHFCFDTLAERNIWLLWDDRVNIKVLCEHEQVLTVELSFMTTEVFWIYVVYAKCDHILRRSLWSHLVDTDIPFGMPWVVVGDFNSILCPEERRGWAFPSLIAMKEFWDFFGSKWFDGWWF